MAFYSRHQILVLLALVAAFGGGLAVDRWRRAHPEVVERIERFDREASAASPTAAAAPGSPPPAATAIADRQPAGATAMSGHPPGVATVTPGSVPPRPTKIRTDSGADRTAPIDLNRASADELTRLPGIGPALATRIVEAREAAPFTSVEDLRRVRGVGASKLDRMRPFVTTRPP